MDANNNNGGFPEWTIPMPESDYGSILGNCEEAELNEYENLFRSSFMTTNGEDFQNGFLSNTVPLLETSVESSFESPPLEYNIPVQTTQIAQTTQEDNRIELSATPGLLTESVEGSDTELEEGEIPTIPRWRDRVLHRIAPKPAQPKPAADTLGTTQNAKLGIPTLASTSLNTSNGPRSGHKRTFDHITDMPRTAAVLPSSESTLGAPPVRNGPVSAIHTITPRPKPGRKPTNEASTNKRTEQNRASQRAFREREKAKLSALEGEVEKYRQQVKELEIERAGSEERLREFDNLQKAVDRQAAELETLREQHKRDQDEIEQLRRNLQQYERMMWEPVMGSVGS